jgi:hypothetical protein
VVMKLQVEGCIVPGAESKTCVLGQAGIGDASLVILPTQSPIELVRAISSSSLPLPMSRERFWKLNWKQQVVILEKVTLDSS